MYTVDDRDIVVELTDVPQSSVGAPCPMVLASEGWLRLAYYLEQSDEDWDGKTVRMVSETTEGELCALVLFKGIRAHMFGPPNDEAFSGHPLASRGLGPYAVFEVQNSSWIRGLERMNSVHPSHSAARFRAYKHYVFAFHDSTFEAVAEGFELGIRNGSVSSVLRESWS